MKPVGKLKNKAEKTENLEESKKVIKEAGMELSDKKKELSDDDLNEVAGGEGYFSFYDPAERPR